ncbi:uncharacterized protein LOC122267759 [Penaeus japonicus]|uniref:uncharacterized protein LOC122267759 n=1 Tax=Penaeus japonicus TaxID=27405 RepID=UPI001C710D6F|nr:uncharacterized protein LOC122267759 [Penaeus japonicus]XP_042893844.1 uncharacterized protein LOC122267759 [Penaeus japonicus]XP_042893845.1 uncharacterized protein LOC122267759 [Penaeus japonicus]
MKGILVCQCILVALTLVATATQGRAHPWRKPVQDIRYQTRYGNIENGQETRQHGKASSIHKHHRIQGQPSDVEELLRETLMELLETAAERRLPARLETNELEDMGIDEEQEALYSARHADMEERPRGHNRQRQSSASYQIHHEEVCKTVKTWKLINETVDVDGNNVLIVNPIEPKQYVYSYECVSPCTACKGVMGQSMCKMRYSYVKMYHRKYSNVSVGEAEWGFVQVPSHCACELIPDNTIDNECYN